MRPSLVLASALAAGLLAPGGARAQLRILPQAGLYAPASDLPTASEAVDIGRKQSTLALGLGVELGNTRGTSLRIDGLHATASDVPVTGVGCQSCSARSTVTTLTAALVLRPLPNIILVRPYLLAGGGLKRYDFTREDLQSEGARAVLSDQNRFTGHLGVGAEVNLGLLRISGEVSDLVSGFRRQGGGGSSLQHDFFVMVGLLLGG